MKFVELNIKTINDREGRKIEDCWAFPQDSFFVVETEADEGEKRVEFIPAAHVSECWGYKKP